MAFLLLGTVLTGPLGAQTIFTFGGYVKFDALYSHYENGDVPETSPLRDIHFPAAIPVGGSSDVFADLDFHVKESRFNFEARNTLADKPIRGFVELDFLLSAQGNTRVSNSFSPRLRHFFLEWGKLLFGQTWSTFMVVIVPEDLDFGGAADGFIFVRQPQVRFSTGNWQFALENPENTFDAYQTGTRILDRAGTIPDLVARYNVQTDRLTWSVAGMFRLLTHEYTNAAGTVERSAKPGFGFTTGGLLRVGRQNDLRFQASAGKGLGRYAAFNFVNAGWLDANDDITARSSVLGWIGYRHWWNERWRSNVNISGVTAQNDAAVSGGTVNRTAWSISANILYSPAPPLTFGLELMRGYRQLEDRTDGSFGRLQFSAKWDFRYSTADDE
jgi:hypothetical protein